MHEKPAVMETSLSPQHFQGSFSKPLADFSKPSFPPAVPQLQSGDNGTHFPEGLGGGWGRAVPKGGVWYHQRNICCTSVLAPPWLQVLAMSAAGIAKQTPFIVIFNQKRIMRKRKEN